MRPRTALAVSILAIVLAVAGMKASERPHPRGYRFQCGVASLYCVLTTLRIAGDYKELESEAHLEGDEVSLAELQRIAKSHGVALIGLQLSFEELVRRKAVAILSMNPNHFVAVVRYSKGMPVVVDLSVDRAWKERILSRTEMDRLWTGKVLAVQNGS